jgi:dUTP pyrophosphatase
MDSTCESCDGFSSEVSNDKDTGCLVCQLPVKLKDEYATPPRVATVGSAGMDLFLNESVILFPDQAPKLVGTGVYVQIPTGFVGLIFLRSSIHDIEFTNGTGVIDSDYRGEIMFKLRAIDHVASYAKGTRIAQMVVIPYLHCNAVVVDELSETKRGEGGFGSTGK